MEPIYQQDYFISDSCVDRYGRLKPSMILFYAQEVAGQHCKELALDYETLAEKRLFWAVTRHRVQITRTPMRGETIRVETWPMPTTKVAYPRSIVAYDEQGREVFRAITVWVLMNLDTRNMILPGKSGIIVSGTLRGTELASPRSLLPMVMMMGNTSFTTPDYKGNTALHYACSLGHVALVRWLVDHGANLEARTEKGASIDVCVGGKNGEIIKGILQQARRERDYPLRGPQASEEEAARAVAWLDKAFRCEEVNSPLYEIPSPDATAQEHAELLFLYVRQNREIPPQVDVTEPLGNLLTWLRDANVHRGMFTEALQKELYQTRSYNLHQLQKAGKSLALLPHMILTRENEGMPFDGATAVYRAACEGNVELVRWLIGYGADRSLRDAEGNEVTLPENTPNAEEIEEALQMHD